MTDLVPELDTISEQSTDPCSLCLSDSGF